jgi:hypothetical protein
MEHGSPINKKEKHAEKKTVFIRPSLTATAHCSKAFYSIEIVCFFDENEETVK